MTRTSREPMLAYTRMKLEKRFWDCLLQEWAISAWDMILRTIWLCLVAAAIIGALRLMAWADTGSRGECPVERSIVPDCFSPEK